MGISGTSFRKWCRDIHRDLSYLFAGVICIYAISGIMLNHKRDFNSNFTITRTELQLQFATPFSEAGDTIPPVSAVDKKIITEFVNQACPKEQMTRYAAVGDSAVKIFFKGGSSLEVNLESGKAVYEKLKKRPVVSSFNRLHYNPSRWWTWFSDIFAVCLMLITVTGLVMLKGPKGLWGRGGIEFIIGILIPLAFILIV